MASSSPKLMCILFLIFALFSQQQIHGREFFNKIPSVNNNEKEQQEEESFVPETQKTSSLPYREEQEQEPRFIPETENGYGLYGHESSHQLPPTTKETYKPYVTPVRYHPDEPYNSIPESNNKINSYETEQKNLGTEARFTERGWSTEENNNNGEKQLGMSDTRYMENGRYFFDVKNDKVNYYPNQYNENNSRGSVSSRNQYNDNMGRYNQEDFEP